MKHRFTMKLSWMLPLLLILVAVHGFIFYRIVSHLTLILGVALIIVLLVKHLGLFGGIYAMWRRRSRQQNDG